jgi:flavin-dependent dehydrogenase
MGVNAGSMQMLDDLGLEYKPPETTTTYISEFALDPETVERHLGSAMHVFLLKIPNLEFAAIIPKGSHATLVMLGREINRELIDAFLDSPVVQRCLPKECQGTHQVCSCSPRISVRGAIKPFADRVVFVGDCGMTRLYKDGIGAAYRTAKAAAKTVVFEGISAEAFAEHYWPACRAIHGDNRIGKLIFAVTQTMMKLRMARRGILRMVQGEQRKTEEKRPMSTVLWDVFTGSAPYKDVLLRTMRPSFVPQVMWETAAASLGVGRTEERKDG